MRGADYVCTILTSDWHLWHKAPVARSAEPSWWEAMARPLAEINRLAHEHQCPVIMAGDLFDKYNPPPELINWAIDNMPTVVAVPGQHDLPCHRYEDVRRSGYWTMVEACKVRHLKHSEPCELADLVLYGFPWGCEVVPCPDRHQLDDRLHVAVVHAYCWRPGHGYVGADAGAKVARWRHQLKGYDVAVFGDNHSGFLSMKMKPGQPHIFNCGTLMRRKMDEREYRPMVGLLHRDGTIVPHYLDCSEDKFIDVPEDAEGVEPGRYEEFLEGLAGLADNWLDFSEALRRFVKDQNVSKDVARVIVRALEGEMEGRR